MGTIYMGEQTQVNLRNNIQSDQLINKKPNQECYLIFYFMETYVVY
jgi:hypothetical protein